MQKTEKIAIFPLGLVLLPNMILPLHIFEERYKEMISDCIKNKTKFGIVYYSGNDFHKSGCIASTVSIVKEYEDGRVEIITEGKERFKITKIYNDKSYMEADIEYFDDQYELDGEDINLAKVEGLRLLQEIMKIYSENFDFSLVDHLNPKTVSFLIAANGGFTMEEKQFFLETINTKERLEKGVKSLQIIIDRLKVSKGIEKIIQSNGYLPKKHD